MKIFRQCFNANPVSASGAVADSTACFQERDGKRYFSGYGGVIYDRSNPGTEYHLFLDVYERFAPGAFDSVLSQKRNLEVRYNHSDEYILGSVADGTAKVRVDQRGIYYDQEFIADIPDHNKVKSYFDRGLIGGSSIGFWVEDFQWDRDGDKEIFWIKKVDMRDLGPVNNPAYTGTGRPAFRNDGGGIAQIQKLYETQKRFRLLDAM